MTNEEIAKCVKLTEEYEIYKKRNGKSNKFEEYWSSDRAKEHKRKLSERLTNIPTELHPSTYIFELTNITTAEKTTLYGTFALAQFLGYASHNPKMDNEYVTDRTGKNVYKVEKYR